MKVSEIFYSIQGNILRPGEVVPNAVQAFLATEGARSHLHVHRE